jgi:hypothetical protein
MQASTDPASKPAPPKSKLKVGVDVPWVTSWSAEASAGIGPCASVNGRLALLQDDNAGAGRPLYSQNHLRRQRESVRAMLCPMCGGPTPPDDRWSQTGKRRAAGVLRARGLASLLHPAIEDARIVLDAGSVSPGHRACMERALLHCPHLQAEEDRELKAFPQQWTVTPLYVEAVPDATPQHYLAHQSLKPSPLPAIAFLQLCGVTQDCDHLWKRTL